MPNDEDDYGRRRAADYEYALGGNTPGGPQQPTPIEKLLLASGMPQKEVPETAHGIMTLMDRMKDDLPAKQRQMVETFMGVAGKSYPNNVDIITEIALQAVKTGLELAADGHEHKGHGHAGPAHKAPVHTAHADSHPKPPSPRVGVAKA